MPLIRLDALCECEGCQKQFGIEIDIASDPEDFVDLEDLVRETIREGAAGYTWGVRGKATVDRFSLPYQPTIQADLLLCDACSKKCDDLPIEGALNREQVNHALGIPMGEDE